MKGLRRGVRKGLKKGGLERKLGNLERGLRMGAREKGAGNPVQSRPKIQTILFVFAFPPLLIFIFNKKIPKGSP